MASGSRKPDPPFRPSCALLERRLDKPRSRQRLGIMAKPRDHLHADRQAAIGDNARER